MTSRQGSKDYPTRVKRESIRLYFEEGWSAREIMERYSISDRNRVGTWVRQYRAEGEAMFEEKRRLSGRRPKQVNTASYVAKLEMLLNHKERVFELPP